VKIKSIEAFAIREEMVGAFDKSTGQRSEARRPPWTRDARVAGPMSGHAAFAAKRASWRLDGSVGCLVTAEDGTTGFGVARYASAVVGLINDHFAPLLVGQDALATGRAWDIMMRISAPYGTSGLASYAVSAVDLALWDLKGKLLGQPVYALLGGPIRDDTPCYATGNDTDWHMELGFSATKLACPYGAFDGLDGLNRNEELIARTREEIGRDVELMLDCWMAFDVEYAVRLAERLKPYNLRWIEDCLLPDQMDGQANLRRRLPWMTLATGEHWYTPTEFLHAVSGRLADILQPDICWAGGLTGCLRINHIAEAAGIEVILHAGMNTPYGQHLTHASANMRWGEFFMGSAPGVPLAEAQVFPGMAVPVNGRLTPNDTPGFGLGLSAEAINGMRI